LILDLCPWASACERVSGIAGGSPELTLVPEEDPHLPLEQLPG